MKRITWTNFGVTGCKAWVRNLQKQKWWAQVTSKKRGVLTSRPDKKHFQMLPIRNWHEDAVRWWWASVISAQGQRCQCGDGRAPHATWFRNSFVQIENCKIAWCNIQNSSGNLKCLFNASTRHFALSPAHCCHRLQTHVIPLGNGRD